MSTTEVCTQPFDANPDVSGLGILIAFYAQAILTFSVFIGAWVIFYIDHGRLRKLTNAVLFDLINNWIAVGIAIIIAALSQWRTISIFHLFISSNLASTIPITSPLGAGVIDHRSNHATLQVAYFAFYGMLRLAISTYLIYRFRFWGNTSGQCFVIPHALPHIDVTLPLILGTALRITWDFCFTVPTLFWLIRAIFGRRKTPMIIVHGLFGRLKQAPAWVQAVIQCVVGFLAPYMVPFIWNAYWTITIVLANQGHVLGDENTFTLGQVGVLVAFVASFYSIGSSYLKYRDQQMHSSTGDPENLKKIKPSEDPETILPDGNTLLPTTTANASWRTC